MAEEIEATIAFADVCQSTRLYETLGDQRAREAIARCIALMRAATERNGGRVIKTIGDEIMASFSNPEAAASALVEMQEEITDRLAVDGFPLAVRAGFHHGVVLLEEGDVFGDAVNTAARMASQAKAGQIMTTGATVDRLPPERQATTRAIDLSTVRGKRDPIAMFDLVRRREDATIMRGVPLQDPRVRNRLVLRFQERTWVVDSGAPTITMGRGTQNDLVIEHALASRLHARVEFRRGRFVLVDQSVNGTCLHRSAAPETWIRRDEAALEGEGVLGLGQAVTEDDAQAIHFAVET